MWFFILLFVYLPTNVIHIKFYLQLVEKLSLWDALYFFKQFIYEIIKKNLKKEKKKCDILIPIRSLQYA